MREEAEVNDQRAHRHKRPEQTNRPDELHLDRADDRQQATSGSVSF